MVLNEDELITLWNRFNPSDQYFEGYWEEFEHYSKREVTEALTFPLWKVIDNEVRRRGLET